MASVQLPTEYLSAGLLPATAEFDRLLCVRVRKLEGEEHEKKLWVPCSKPDAPAAPTPDELLRLAPLERVLTAVLAAQQLYCDAEALVVAFAPLFREVGAHKVDRSQEAINELFAIRVETTQDSRVYKVDPEVSIKV